MKYQFLNFMRFFAALIVMVFHVNNNWLVYQNIPEIFTNGYTWVFFFFMISGLLMATKKKTIDDPYQYVWHKIKKIYPVYLIGLIIMLIINHEKITSLNLFSALTLTQVYTLNYLPFTDPSWYLSVLLFLSFIFPFIDSLFRKREILSIGLSLGIIIYTDWFIRLIANTKGAPKHAGLWMNMNYLQKFTPITFIGVLMAGVSIYYISKKLTEHQGYSVAILIYLLLMPIIYSHLFPQNYYLKNIFIFTPFILFIALDSGFLNNICKHWTIRFLGKLSMPIFLLHIPIKSIFVQITGGLTSNIMFIIYYLLVIVTATFIVLMQEHLYRLKGKKNGLPNFEGS